MKAVLAGSGSRGVIPETRCCVVGLAALRGRFTSCLGDAGGAAAAGSVVGLPGRRSCARTLSRLRPQKDRLDKFILR